MLVARALLILAVALSAVFYALTFDSIAVDTRIDDVSPELYGDKNIKQAANAVSDYVARQFLLLIQAENETLADQAENHILKQLKGVSSIQINSNDTFTSQLLTLLSEYRFNFLSKQQQLIIENENVEAIVGQAYQQLFALDGGTRIIDFEQDPLGIFTEYILSSADDTLLSNLIVNGAASGKESQVYRAISVSLPKQPLDMQSQIYLRNQLDAIEKNVESQFSISLYRSGLFFFSVDAAEKSKADIQLIALGSMLSVFLLMFIVFRSLSPLILATLSILIGVVFAFSATLWLFGSIHILTIVFGASLIGIVVDYSIHYVSHSVVINQQQSGDHKNRLFKALLLSVLTSFLGYSALGLSDLQALKKVAFFSCCGLVVAWLCVVVLGSSIVRQSVNFNASFLRKILRLIESIKSKYYVFFGIVLTGLSLGYLTLSGFAVNDNPSAFFSPSKELLQQEQLVAEVVSSYEPGRYLLVQGQSADQIYSSVEQYRTALGGDLSDRIIGIDQLLPSRAEQIQNYHLQDQFYRDEGVLDQFYQRLGLPIEQGESLKRAYRQSQDTILSPDEFLATLTTLPPTWLQINNQYYHFLLIEKGVDLSVIKNASENFESITYINTIALAESALKNQRATAAWLLVSAYGLVALMLLIVYRHIKALTMICVPAIASVITIAVLALCGQAITLFHVMSLFLVLGLGMDYMIFAREMKHSAHESKQAILLAAITSFFSFGLLALSSMPIVQAFGSTILIGNIINLFGALGLYQKKVSTG